ncbi:hypothetical protein Tsp_03235 [Trichinella spiralis]|uniref:hypothetical protein n=1 Tax=Trichinella spiralis TaxID=6334 RepID=UPI0001EFC1BE|nr:hypothetical protein Tsp_03235 [Trichinella spiralis]
MLCTYGSQSNVVSMVSSIAYRRSGTCGNIVALLNIIYDEEISHGLQWNITYMCHEEQIEIATSLNPQVEQMISTFLSYAPDLTKRQLSLGNPYKQEIISWLEYSFVSTALDTLPSMLILRVTGSIFHQQNRLILDHSRLNRMNITRSTCVIIVSNLVTWVSGKMKLQNVNENMLRKFTPLHKLKKDIFSMGIHINKKPPAGGNIHVSTALDTLPSILILRVTGVIFTESFGINASILNNMNNTRPRSDQEQLIRSEMCEMNYANIPHHNRIIRYGHSRMCQVRKNNLVSHLLIPIDNPNEGWLQCLSKHYKTLCAGYCIAQAKCSLPNEYSEM